MLKSKGGAVVWWLARNEDKVNEDNVKDAAGLIEALEKLSNAANSTEVYSLNGSSYDGINSPGGSSLNGRLVVELFGEWMGTLNLDGNQPAMFAHQCARVVDRFGKHDEAREIRGRFDPPGPDEEPPLPEEPW